jgi:DNA-binding transcriptional MocR family regulator
VFVVRRCSSALDRFAPAGSRWTKPLGGFFILMELAGEADATVMLPAAIEAGVAYVPGQRSLSTEAARTPCVLLFRKESPEAIADGVERMCRIFKHAMTQKA